MTCIEIGLAPHRRIPGAAPPIRPGVSGMVTVLLPKCYSGRGNSPGDGSKRFSRSTCRVGGKMSTARRPPPGHTLWGRVGAAGGRRPPGRAPRCERRPGRRVRGRTSSTSGCTAANRPANTAANGPGRSPRFLRPLLCSATERGTLGNLRAAWEEFHEKGRRLPG
jgi:hypothetical protein